MAAGVPVDWSKEKGGDPIARLGRRIYDYTNYVLGLDVNEPGQSNLKSVQVKCCNSCDSLSKRDTLTRCLFVVCRSRNE